MCICMYISVYIYVYMYVMSECGHKGELRSSNDDIISAVDKYLLPLGSKHCNTNKNVWTAKGTMLDLI